MGISIGTQLHPYFGAVHKLMLDCFVIGIFDRQKCPAGSSQANPFACIASGIAALWGPAHGGANEVCFNPAVF